MQYDTKSLLIGAGVAAVVVLGGVWIYHTSQSRALMGRARRFVSRVTARGDDGLTPCERAARARAYAQGAVGTIPLSYGTGSPNRARRVD